ncbi:hypothetical protein LWC34_07075 [Kibdelosporangium philippinense]|uniref:Serine/threonine protein kinase n=1 Tax=Kibdelosporangium philippinense TaxID=211113 RepID=A0ABS8Z6A5_9PSEU|nr:hypothetical protein [Kibdelosporangium philippinense]MCE7002593.1 hypothetical protein [Kibdelosporangium philippinense]
MSSDIPTAPPAAEQPGYQPQPEPKRKKGLPKWLVSLIALIVVGGGVYAFQYFTNDAAQAKAGDCATVSGSKTSPKYEAVACDSAAVTHVVGKALTNTSENCAVGEARYDEFTMTGRGPDTKLCLMPKWGEGECRTILDDTNLEYPKVDCAGAKGNENAVKIVKVMTGSVDPATCPEGSGGLTFPEPPTVYCFAQPE